MSIKGLFDTIGDVWSGMPLRDKAAIATSPVPIVGDLVGAYADARHIWEQYGKTGKVPWTAVKKLGVKGGGKSLAPLGLNRPQSEFIRKVGGLTDRAYIPVAGNIAESGIRIYKPSRRSEQGGLLPIDPLL